MSLQEKFVPADGLFAVSLALTQFRFVDEKHMVSVGQDFFNLFLIHFCSSLGKDAG